MNSFLAFKDISAPNNFSFFLRKIGKMQSFIVRYHFLEKQFILCYTNPMRKQDCPRTVATACISLETVKPSMGDPLRMIKML